MITLITITTSDERVARNKFLLSKNPFFQQIFILYIFHLSSFRHCCLGYFEVLPSSYHGVNKKSLLFIHTSTVDKKNTFNLDYRSH